MSRLFDDLEDQLREAARRRVRGGDAPAPEPAGRRPRWAWLREGLRTLPVVGAVGVALAVAALVLIGHGHPAHPATQAAGPAARAGSLLTDSPLLRRELSYIHDATRQVQASPACRARGPAMPATIGGTPSQPMRAMLGVLRRPVTAADRLPQGWNMGGMASAYRGWARRALTVGGVSYWVVPARDHPDAEQPTPHCLRLQQAAVHAYLPQVPAAQRRPTLRLATRLIASDLAIVSRGPFDVICTVSHSGSGGGAGCGETVAEVGQGQTPSEDNGVFVGVVPDGVASVTVRVAAQAGRPAESATGTVQGNMFAVRVPGVGDQVDHGVTAIWRSASGTVVRTLREPGPGATWTACRRHPVACYGVSEGSVGSSSSTTASAPTAPGS